MKRKLFLVSAGIVAAMSMVDAALAQTGNVVVSGQSNLVIIDGNNNGPDANDCRLTASLMSGLLTVTAAQDSTTPVLLCAADYFGYFVSGTDSSSDYAGAEVNFSTPTVPDLPLAGEFVDEEAVPDGPPVRFNDPADYFSVEQGLGGTELANVLLCQADGPAALVRLPGLTSFLMQLSFFTDASNQMYLVVPSLTLGLAANPSQTATLNGYVPLTSNRSLTVAVDTAPSALILDINFNQTPPCSTRTAAPTLTEWGLIGFALSLLAGGVLTLRRRSAFANAL
jgi:hypothetical protein